MNRLYRLIIMVTIITLLTGCGTKPEDELYKVFESAAKQEKNMFETTQKLQALEVKSKQLYEEILITGQENSEHAKEYLIRAIENTKEREKILQEENKMLDTAYQRMEDAAKSIRDLEEPQLKKQAKVVSKAYADRYQAFRAMQNSYQKMLEAELVLYEKLQSKDEKLKPINIQVKHVNELYVDVETKKEFFNTYTKQYNEAKASFYRMAKFEIESNA
ncbi:YkyA family protein [Ectobacillus sp. JY-23]|uniref:YkyA family protein n=1 Tax=Ectobacillus sp. JY-23 TaxID=2933872 RepID=UPI001FF46D5A|nr:YkyA family protein [Ectobacillus sp. JY-23]UOY93811.1 YkyA family protein [Ectobacillus sp. JY-23]